MSNYGYTATDDLWQFRGASGRTRKGMMIRNPNYGVVWAAKADRLSSCGLMQDYYEEFTAVEGARKATNFLERKERRRLRKEARALRKKGKAAWKQCKQVSKLAEARGEDPMAASLATSRVAVATPRDPMYPDGVPEDYFPSADPALDPGYYEEEGEGPDWLLWGGLGAGALLVAALVMKKRKKR
jgi:LPXTG-motif cell wall-anchored protein